MGCSYLTTSLLFLFAIGVMGDAAGLQAFPVYTLSQLAGSGSMVRMDALYTGFWIFAIFIKAALLIYCAVETLPGSGGHKGKCLGCRFGGLCRQLCTGTVDDCGSALAVDHSGALRSVFLSHSPGLATGAQKGAWYK